MATVEGHVPWSFGLPGAVLAGTADFGVAVGAEQLVHDESLFLGCEHLSISSHTSRRITQRTTNSCTVGCAIRRHRQDQLARSAKAG